MMIKNNGIKKYALLLCIVSLSASLYADDIGYSTVGSSSNTVGNNVGANIYGAKFTSVNGGSLTTAYINGHNNWNGADTVVILIYDDTGGYPHTLIAESAEINISTSSFTWWTVSISGTILASMDYWIFVRNKTIGSSSVRVHYDGNTITGLRRNDTTPTDNPFANGATTNNNQEYSIYISYTVGGGGGALPQIRRRILNNLRRN